MILEKCINNLEEIETCHFTLQIATEAQLFSFCFIFADGTQATVLGRPRGRGLLKVALARVSFCRSMGGQDAPRKEEGGRWVWRELCRAGLCTTQEVGALHRSELPP